MVKKGLKCGIPSIIAQHSTMFSFYSSNACIQSSSLLNASMHFVIRGFRGQRRRKIGDMNINGDHN